MLNELGWIKLKADVDPLTASKADIAENPKNIQIVELEAAQLPRSRADVDFAIVNGNYAMSSGMKLTEALFQEPSFAYVNWSAVRTAGQRQPMVERCNPKPYNSDEFKAYSQKRFAGYKYPAAWGENAAVGAQSRSRLYCFCNQINRSLKRRLNVQTAFSIITHKVKKIISY